MDVCSPGKLIKELQDMGVPAIALYPNDDDGTVMVRLHFADVGKAQKMNSLFLTTEETEGEEGEEDDEKKEDLPSANYKFANELADRLKLRDGVRLELDASQ